MEPIRKHSALHLAEKLVFGRNSSGSAALQGLRWNVEGAITAQIVAGTVDFRCVSTTVHLYLPFRILKDDVLHGFFSFRDIIVAFCAGFIYFVKFFHVPGIQISAISTLLFHLLVISFLLTAFQWSNLDVGFMISFVIL